MSKVSISGNASGTGVFTIQAPNSNVDRVLSLPDEAGTVLTSAGVPASAMPAGSVIQVVQVPAPSSVTVSSGQATPTAWQTIVSASITPTSTTSKIYISWTTGYSMLSGNTWSACGFVMWRDTVGVNQIGSVYGLIGYDTSAALNHRINQCDGQTIDIPASTGSVTYYLTGRAENGNGQVSAQTLFAGYSPAVLTLMEIAA